LKTARRATALTPEPFASSIMNLSRLGCW
jgi:hypothetical protein